MDESQRSVLVWERVWDERPPIDARVVVLRAKVPDGYLVSTRWGDDPFSTIFLPCDSWDVATTTKALLPLRPPEPKRTSPPIRAIIPRTRKKVPPGGAT